MQDDMESNWKPRKPLTPALKARVFPWELMTQIKPQGSGGNRVPRKAHGEEECVAVRGKFSMSRA